MHIAKVEVLVLDIPMIDTLVVSFGKIDRLRPIIITITDELGNRGYGESILLPYSVTPFESFNTGLFALKDLIIPAIVGKEIILGGSAYTAIENFIDLYQHIHGFEMTKSGVQNAFVDLMTQRYHLSLYELFETKSDTIHVGASIGIPQNMDEYLNKINTFVEKGVQRIKLKIARGKDALLISEVRKNFPDIELTIDANCDYDLESFLDLLPLIDASNICMVEQPFAYNNFMANLELKKVMKTPLCLDESIRSIQDVESYRMSHGCDIVNIKIGRVGGVYSAYKINKHCESYNIGTWVGGLLETDLGRSFNIAIAGMNNCRFDHDFSAWDEYYSGHIMKNPYVIENRQIHIDLSRKGIGFEVDTEKIHYYTNQRLIYE